MSPDSSVRFRALDWAGDEQAERRRERRRARVQQAAMVLICTGYLVTLVALAQFADRQAHRAIRSVGDGVLVLTSANAATVDQVGPPPADGTKPGTNSGAK